MCHKQKNCVNSCFLLIAFLLRGLFLFLIKQSLFKVLYMVYRVLFKVHSGRFLSYSNSRNNHSFSLAVTCCTTRCHSLSLDVITRLSLYKRSFQIAILKLWVEGLIGIMIIFTLRITYYYNQPYYLKSKYRNARCQTYVSN